MKNYKHTPGPWRIVEPNRRDIGGAQIRIEPGDPRDLTAVATLYAGEMFPRADADARLIAAAPDLLAALYLILGSPVHDNGLYDGSDRTVGQLCREVIAKAEGKS